MVNASKRGPAKWQTQLDKDKVRRAFEEAIIDCYGEYEQHSGLLTMIEQEVKFPFQAQVLGNIVKVVGMEWPDDDEFGLDFVCEHKGKRHRVEARSVDLVSPFPEGHLYIAAYLDWKKTL
ncbi:MAG: calcium-binding protein [Acidobacteria bacterium]|nr:calcium-binding protein [Acidobacteriota bacterium]